MFWTCIFIILSHWATFAIFWITTAPLYKEYWTCICQNPIPSWNQNSFVMHRNTMVLTNVIHPTQGNFRMAHSGILNPSTVARTHELIIWYLEEIIPPQGLFAETIILCYSHAWGIHLFSRTLWMHLVTKAEEFWLLYWPPPALGDIVTLQHLTSSSSLNEHVGTVIVSRVKTLMK